jgi:plastocyanin
VIDVQNPTVRGTPLVGRERSLMARVRIVAVVIAILLILPACQGDGAGGTIPDPRGGYGGMGIATPPSRTGVTLLGPDTFPCRPATGQEQGYFRYGPGRMRRGGLEPEPLERNHIVIDGEGANFHGVGHVIDGGTIEMEMDDAYFAPTILKGPAGATVTIELENEGVRQHNFSVPSQGIDLNCGVRARGEVEVVFPRSGELMFTCKYTGTSGMRGELAVRT